MTRQDLGILGIELCEFGLRLDQCLIRGVGGNLENGDLLNDGQQVVARQLRCFVCVLLLRLVAFFFTLFSIVLDVIVVLVAVVAG